MINLSYDSNAAGYCELNDAVFAHITVRCADMEDVDCIVAVGTNDVGLQMVQIDGVSQRNGDSVQWEITKPRGMESDLAAWAARLLNGVMFAADLVALGFDRVN